MITTSIFALFVLVAAVVYYRLPGRAQRLWLLALSYIFIATWSWAFALMLLVATSANYRLGWRVAGGGRGWLWLGIGFNVSTLVYFKYVVFFVPDLLAAVDRIGFTGPTDVFRLALPLGLSYYSLQAISYLVDVHRRQMQPVADEADFGLYMAYFPKLVAGPIERARTFVPRLAEPRVVDNGVLTSAFGLIVLGLVRKLVVADPLAALIPEHAFYTPAEFSAPQLWAFLLAYGFYLYNDFAGYTDMVRGVSRIFGIELSSNFRTPYFSRTFTEFWARWHISLSEWLRDYVYMPLTRALLRRRFAPRGWVSLAVPPIATMMVSALWHATLAHKTVLLWGVLHGGYQVVERVRMIRRPALPPDQWPRRAQLIGAATVFLLAMIAWVPFREGSQPGTTLATWAAMLRWDRLAPPDPRIALVILPALLLDWVQYRATDELVFLRWPRPAQATLLATATLLILFMLQADPGPPFVYQGF